MIRYEDFDKEGYYRLAETYTYNDESGVRLDQYYYTEDCSRLWKEARSWNGVIDLKIYYPAAEYYPHVEWLYDQGQVQRIEYWGAYDWDTNFGALEVDPETGLITLVSGVDLEGKPLAEQYQVGQIYQEPPEMAG